MSQFVTEDVTEKVKGSRMAKHVVMKSILREQIREDADESTLSDLIMRIYRLFYDSNMVDSIYSDLKERERKKQELQEMELEGLASMAFESSEVGAESVSTLEIDDTMIESLAVLGEQIPYEEVYRVLKMARINVIIDFFSAFQGSTSSMIETTSQLTGVDMKNILDLFSLFVEKQIEDPKLEGMDPDQIGKNLGSSALNVDIVDESYSIFMYAPKKWLDKGQTQRLSIGLMIHDDWAKYISIMSPFIAKKLNEITDTVLGTTRDDLSNISFRLVDLSLTKKLKIQIKGIAEYIARISLSWDQIQS
ncbi:MAG: hypothetical protein ACXACU_05630 [Candidatus Hodarchaeales archaeon]|jgi:hypothetical protein